MSQQIKFQIYSEIQHPVITINTQCSKIQIKESNQILLLLNDEKYSISLSILLEIFSSRENQYLKIRNIETNDVWVINSNILIEVRNYFNPQNVGQYTIDEFVRRFNIKREESSEQAVDESSNSIIYSYDCIESQRLLNQQHFAEYFSKKDNIQQSFQFLCKIFQPDQNSLLNESQILLLEQTDSFMEDLSQREEEIINAILDYNLMIQSKFNDKMIAQGEQSNQIIDQQKQKSSKGSIDSSHHQISFQSLIDLSVQYKTQQISFETMYTKLKGYADRQQVNLFLEMAKKNHLLLQTAQSTSLVKFKVQQIYIDKFKFKMTKGKRIKLSLLSKEQFILLMFSISMGIFELQKMNICNLDVKFENVLSFQINEKERYFLIDFDYCFCIESNDTKICQQMKNIIQYIDHIRSEQKLTKFLEIIFKDIQKQQLTKITSRIRQPKHNQYVFFCSELKQYSRNVNWNRYIDMWNEVISSNQQISEVDKKELSLILEFIKKPDMSFQKICGYLKQKYPSETNCKK